LKFKTGIGFDIHRLEEGRKLYLGGIEIPSAKGLVGHSDGDCLIHALMDGLLGAAGERDIGQIFPDTDPKYKDIRSTELLSDVVRRLKEKRIEIINIDSIVIAEEPYLAPFIPRMKEVLSSILQIDKDDLGIKAKTQEGINFIGQGKAIAAWVSVLIREKR
jgi:2-C-methyl-D-erythritol 2,4-cyclodiphosphate synthase